MESINENLNHKEQQSIEENKIFEKKMRKSTLKNKKNYS